PDTPAGCRTLCPAAAPPARRIHTMAAWIAFRLSGVSATDHTLASRTLYFDVHRRGWSEELLALVDLTPDILAPLAASGTPLGPVHREILAETGLAGLPLVAAGAHDHLCGSYGAGVVKPGLMLDSMGTAEAAVLVTAAPQRDPAVMRHGFIQGAIATHRALAYLGGTNNSCGGAIEWFR